MDIKDCKVGQIVKGNNEDRYSITNEDMVKGEIVQIKEERIAVKVLEHKTMPNRVGASYPVFPQYFDLVKDVPKDPKTEHLLQMEYDKEKQCAFIIVSNKYTLALPIKELDFNSIGVSIKNDSDEYNEEIGKTLALFRMK